MNLQLHPVARLRAYTGIVLGVLITLLYAIAFVLLHLVWHLTNWLVPHRSLAYRIPPVWLWNLKRVVYEFVMGVKFDIQNEIAGDTRGPKVVEMNHGSFIEMFLAYAVALRFISGDSVIVTKLELLWHPVAAPIIIWPMIFGGRWIGLDRKNASACVMAITRFLDRQGDNPDITIFVLCDGTRPTLKKRTEHHQNTGEIWHRVLRPKRRGPWLLSHALGQASLRAHGVEARRYEIAHGVSTPQVTETDVHRMVGGTYWARLRAILTPLPSTAEAYGEELTTRFREIDEELTKRETN